MNGPDQQASSTQPGPALFAFPNHVFTDWGRERASVLPGLFDPERCARWERETRHLPTVLAHYPSDRSLCWPQTSFHDIEGPSPCGGLADDPNFIREIERVTRLGSMDPSKSLTWINRYRPGDSVPEHVDSYGDCQLLVCLQGPPDPDKGGQTQLLGREIRLRTGDALLWKASLLPHAMSRITDAQLGPSGASRVVYVIRLYLA